MKPFRKKKITKNLIIILVITIMLSGLLPNFVQAKTDTDGGGKILPAISQFAVFLGDKVMQWLQNTFTSTESIAQGEGVYNFQYSPAIIFSGTVPAFDINFIDPTESVISKKVDTEYIVSLLDALDLNGAKQILKKQYAGGIAYVFTTRNGVIKDIKNDEQYEYDASREIDLELLEGKLQSHEYDEETYIFAGITFESTSEYLKLAWYSEDESKVYVIVDSRSGGETSGVYSAEGIIYLVEIGTYEDLNESTKITNTEKVETKTYESTAGILQSTIATWYNVLRRISLVGLLSVLVYVGIRIVISSSAEDKAKYKEMLKDWLVAICLLFTLHYIMNATVTITNEISDIFETGETDELLNTLRTNIYARESWGEVVAQAIMYVVLVIYTVVFTVQYIGRVIYMAFYTLIAPLIALTYPLDKIKDGQAQAFNMWIKEYVFTALVQVIHLVIYFVLVGSALSLVKDYPLYAIVVLLFIKKAEDLIKKMFGFDKSETVGALGAAATGALVMNAFKQIPHGGPKGAGGGSKNDGSDSKGVRTATKDPLSALKGNKTEKSGGGTTSESASTLNSDKKSNRAKQLLNNIRDSKPVRVTTALGKRYLGPGVKNLAKGFVGGTGALIGFSAGIAQGDISSAIGGAFAGGKAGSGLVDWGANTASGIGRTFNEARDTFNDGAYGKEVAQNMRFDKKFRKSETYRALQSNPSFSDGNIQAMLDVGITEKKAMEKILNNSNGGNDIGNAIVNYTLAKDCPDSIFYDKDDSKLQMWLETQNEELGKIDVKTMRENMKKFK